MAGEAETRAVRDRLVPPAILSLDRDYVLRLDWNAMALIEEKFDLNSLEDLDQVWNLFKSDSIRTRQLMLWILLQADDPNMTIHQVGALLRPGRIVEVWSAMADAFNNAMVRDEDREPEGPADAQGEEVQPRGAPSLTSGLSDEKTSTSSPESSAATPLESSSPSGDATETERTAKTSVPG